MRLLVDTSILIGLLNPELHALDPTILGAITHPHARVHGSVASLWEIAIKVRLRKLALGIPLETLPSVIDRIGLTLIAINHHHVLAVAEPEPATRDPFDRLLLAQSLVENLRLVTIDRALVGHPLAWRPD